MSSPQLFPPETASDLSRFLPDEAPAMVESARRHVKVHACGVCFDSRGVGGWGVVLRCRGISRELSGVVTATTPNRIALIASIAALEDLALSCVVDVSTDSEYVARGITSWIGGWKENGWRTTRGGLVKNADLWTRLDASRERHRARWLQVRVLSESPAGRLALAALNGSHFRWR
jgi:ribonuclease HI